MANMAYIRPMSSTTHTVTPDSGGFFSVLSGRSGKTYRVTPLSGEFALCECEAFRFRAACSHIDAVIAFSAEVLKAVVVKDHPYDCCSDNQYCDERGQSCHECGGSREEHAAATNVFARIEASERNWLRQDLTPWPGKKRELL